MPRELHQLGNVRRLPIIFKDSADSLIDPSTVIFKMREPDETITTYTYGVDAELKKASVGNYYVDWTFDQAGRHFYQWNGSGTGAAIEEDEIVIEAGSFQ